jgi:uncharacterized FAD-dependent dehydrogenase
LAFETWRALGIEVGVTEPEDVIRARALELAGIGEADLRGFRIARKSLDARRVRGERKLRFVIHADLVVDAASVGRARARRALGPGRARAEPGRLEVELVHASLAGRRVAVLGAGPAGLFAALVLARNGVAVDLVDRGAAPRERGRDLAAFQRSRVRARTRRATSRSARAAPAPTGREALHPRGARARAPILDELAHAARPTRSATTRARIVVPTGCTGSCRLRARLEAGGVRFHWRTRVDALQLAAREPGRVVALGTSHGELGCDALVFAPGHSARDTWHALAAQGLPLEAKPFQLGVRIEHPQALVDRGRYGDGPDARELGPAYYALTCRPSEARPARTASACAPAARSWRASPRRDCSARTA